MSFETVEFLQAALRNGPDDIKYCLIPVDPDFGIPSLIFDEFIVQENISFFDEPNRSGKLYFYDRVEVKKWYAINKDIHPEFK